MNQYELMDDMNRRVLEMNKRCAAINFRQQFVDTQLQVLLGVIVAAVTAPWAVLAAEIRARNP